MAAQATVLPASIAGLPANSEKVGVFPGALNNRGPRWGSVLLLEPFAEPQPQVVPSSILLPPLVVSPVQFPPALNATMVLVSVVVVPPGSVPTAPPLPALLAAKVLLRMLTVPAWL